MPPSESEVSSRWPGGPGVPTPGELGPLVFRGKRRRRRLRIAAVSAVLLAAVVVAAGTLFSFSHAIVFRQVGIGPIKLLPVAAVAHAHFAQYTLPTPNAVPTSLIVGPDGALYFLEAGTGAVGRFTPAGAVFRTFELRRHIGALVAGPDGALWLTEPDANAIGRLSLQGVLSEYPIADIDKVPDQISVGPDGALWFTEVETIGRISTTGGITQLPMGGVSSPTSIVTDHGAIWVSDDARGLISRLTPSGTRTDFAVPHGAHPEAMTVGPDGALWWLDARQNEIGRMTISGSAREYSIPTNVSALTSICAGPDGNVWFTELQGDNVGRLTPDGLVTEFKAPDGSSPTGIVAGPDGNVWFTEPGTNQLGEIILHPHPY
jgi:streptogramin lyase